MSDIVQVSALQKKLLYERSYTSLEYAMVAEGSEYAWICLNGSWICLNMPESAGFYF